MKARNGFTLIELLVVIVILAILVALVIGSFASAQAAGRRASCTSNLAQIAKAFVNYAGNNDDLFPYYKDAPQEEWVRRLANYMGVANTGITGEPTLADCSKSKAFLSPMALHYAKKNGKKIAADRQISYGTNYSLNNKTSVKATPRRLSDFEYPTQTMVVALTQRDDAISGWKLRADAADYNAKTAPVYQQTGTSEAGVTVAWLDGRAQYMTFEQVPVSSGQGLEYWKDANGKEYNYGYGTFWQGLPKYDSAQWP